MSARMNNDLFRRIEWAGVAVRMSDGTLYAFEMDGGQIEGEITVEEVEPFDEPTVFMDRVYASVRNRVEVKLRGEGRTSARFYDAAQHRTPPAEIEGR